MKLNSSKKTRLGPTQNYTTIWLHTDRIGLPFVSFRQGNCFFGTLGARDGPIRVVEPIFGPGRFVCSCGFGFLLDSLVLINYYFSQLRDAITKARTFPQTKKNQKSSSGKPPLRRRRCTQNVQPSVIHRLQLPDLDNMYPTFCQNIARIPF